MRSPTGPGVINAVSAMSGALDAGVTGSCAAPISAGAVLINAAITAYAAGARRLLAAVV
ncbi:hypothetical protein H7J83_25290 [Mycobacterium mantenii]|uniref:hypothetical protein n=1 Tax=Mycobacterium mantenii TaxID=560555 RepID=UPI00130205F8|nr:hypothetical protein [Mycobacterium mantenii]MCV7245996.1 hypothetical protein [Mycobacterium mantenii]